MIKIITVISSKLALCLWLLLSTQVIAKPSQSDLLSPALKAQFSKEILSESEMSQKADATGKIYAECITETAQAIRSRFPMAQQNMVLEVVNMTCQDMEDWFNLYSILLASYSMKKPISEQDASVYLEDSYKTKGRSAANTEQRTKLYKSLGILKDERL